MTLHRQPDRLPMSTRASEGGIPLRRPSTTPAIHLDEHLPGEPFQVACGASAAMLRSTREPARVTCWRCLAHLRGDDA